MRMTPPTTAAGSFAAHSPQLATARTEAVSSARGDDGSFKRPSSSASEGGLFLFDFDGGEHSDLLSTRANHIDFATRDLTCIPTQWFAIVVMR